MNQFSTIETAGKVEEFCAPSTVTCLECGGSLEGLLSHLFDTRFGIDGSYDIRRCVECGLEQIYPLPESKELRSLYENHYNFDGEKETLYTKMRGYFLDSVLYRIWTWSDGDVSFHGRKGAGRLLDIGCNEGRSLKIFARNGYHVTGLELNNEAATVARAAGFTVHVCDIANFEPVFFYDVAVLSNVLEHSLAPGRMLRDIARVLKPGGEIWISCPNSRSWQRSLFARAWINWHVPFHIAHFSQASLERLLRDAGCVCTKVRHVSPAAWLASSLIVLAFFHPGKATRQLRNPLLFPLAMFAVKILLFPFLLLANSVGRGDGLVVVAQKS
ncbi:MAG TPA: class I SAM-dependent methyltransferase [Candidatus Acidoferrales bacterium]|nr:class I SAM-dependent methyltransferase [Candidatus Acidoferrales bacterium]